MQCENGDFHWQEITGNSPTYPGKKNWTSKPVIIRNGKQQSKLKYVSEVPLTDYHAEPLVESQNPVQVSAQSYI